MFFILFAVTVAGEWSPGELGPAGKSKGSE